MEKRVKRTNAEIEKDFERAKKACKENRFCSFEELLEHLNKDENVHKKLSLKMLEKSFEKHSTTYKRLKVEFEQNAKAKAQALEVDTTDVEKAKAVLNDKHYFVIDASTTRLNDFVNRIEQILTTKSDIVLTDVTICELDKLQFTDDLSGRNAKYLLRVAAKTPERFICVQSDNEILSPDARIIKYCASIKESCTLLSADKVMVLMARKDGITAPYWDNEPEKYVAEKIDDDLSSLTSNDVEFVNDKLIISCYMAEFKAQRVFSNGVEFRKGEYRAKIGDDIYIASKKQDYYTFCHYEVANIRKSSNVKIISHRRIYTIDDLNSLKSNYKAFMKEFINYSSENS